MRINKTSAKIFGFFWRYGAMILGVICSVLLGVFIEYNIMIFGFAATFAVIGVEYILASALNMPHIFVVYASINHRPADWYKLFVDENKATRKEMYKNGGFLTGVGVFFAVAYLIFLLVK